MNLKISLPAIPIVYIILVIAKIMGMLSWGWFAVITSIVWIPIMIVVVTFAVMMLFILISALLAAWAD